MNIEIKQDLGYRYLVIEAGEEENDFRIQMLAHQTMKELLPCRIRRINGTLLLAYDIGAKQSFRELCAGQGASYDILRAFLQTMYKVGVHMREYLLDIDMLLLSPEYIFCDAAGAEVFFCCAPKVAEDSMEQFHSLSKFLLGVLEHTDQKAVQLGYQMYRSSMHSGAGMSDIWKQMLPYIEESASKDGIMKDGIEEADAIRADISEACVSEACMPETGVPEAGVSKACMSETGMSEACVPETGVSKACMPETGVPEAGVSKACMSETGVSEAAETDVWADGGRWDRDEAGTGSGGRSQNKMEKQEKRRKSEKKRRFSFRNLFGDGEPLPAYAGEKLFSYGEKGCVLRGCVKGLPMFQPSVSPFLIGSLEFAVDGFIDDVTVSRFHAKLEKRADGYYLTDLDSAHGTQINQVSLTPQRQVRLNDGDEICFGKARFRFSS